MKVRPFTKVIIMIAANCWTKPPYTYAMNMEIFYITTFLKVMSENNKEVCATIEKVHFNYEYN